LGVRRNGAGREALRLRKRPVPLPAATLPGLRESQWPLLTEARPNEPGWPRRPVPQHRVAESPRRGEHRIERFGWTFGAGDNVMQVEHDYNKDGFAVCIARGAAQLNWRRCAPQLGRHVGVARPGRALHPLSGCVDRPVPIRRCGPRTNGIAAIKRPGEIPGQNGVNSEMGPSSDGSKARRLTPRSACGTREEAEQTGA